MTAQAVLTELPADQGRYVIDTEDAVFTLDFDTLTLTTLRIDEEGRGGTATPTEHLLADVHVCKYGEPMLLEFFGGEDWDYLETKPVIGITAERGL